MDRDSLLGLISIHNNITYIITVYELRITNYELRRCYNDLHMLI